jgi:hypothetical protein
MAATSPVASVTTTPRWKVRHGVRTEASKRQARPDQPAKAEALRQAGRDPCPCRSASTSHARSSSSSGVSVGSALAPLARCRARTSPESLIDVPSLSEGGPCSPAARSSIRGLSASAGGTAEAPVGAIWPIPIWERRRRAERGPCMVTVHLLSMLAVAVCLRCRMRPALSESHMVARPKVWCRRGANR